MLTHSSPVIAIAGDGGPCHEQLERVLGARGLRTVRFDPHAVEPAPLALALLDAHHHLQLLPSLSERDVAVVAYGRDPALALEAGRLGARAWLSVPLDDAAIGRCIEAQLAPAGSKRAPSSSKPRPGHRSQIAELDSREPAMQAALRTVEAAAAADVPVLLRGESGTGKGELAKLLHQKSARSDRPFVVVSCPTLSEELLSAELFGHARGAFTGAVRDRPGRVEAAEGGTLFLDEIGDLSPRLQVMLLRFLQDKEYERVGETRTRKGDVRVVTATHRDLEADVEGGLFRLDLYYRLAVVEVRVPPLRERMEDIVPLAERLLRQAAATQGIAVPELSAAAKALLASHDWPGNVRELKNEIERALALGRPAIVEPAMFSERLARPGRRPTPRVGGPFTIDEIEREHIERVLRQSSTFEAAAATLGIDDSTLWRKRKRYAGRAA